MRRLCLTKPTPLIAGLLAGLLFAIIATPLGAAPAETQPQHPVFGYDKSHEVTLTGTIAQTVTKHIAGTPAGLHLLVTGPEGTIDAHLGPYMSKDILEALHAGTPVQIVGAMEKAHGKTILLAREVTVGGRQVKVRNENGMLIQAQTAQSHHSKQKSGLAVNGGGR
jgi:hypothetical protein